MGILPFSPMEFLMAHLYLMRHGCLLPNPERRFIGQSNVPLSPKGREQALFWREELSAIPFCRALCSDLTRCVETASIILEGRNVALETHPALRELHLGAWEGLTKAEVEARFPCAWEARGRDFWNYVPHGGESFAMLERRILPVLEKLLSSAGEGDSILLVAHAAVNRVILRRWLALPFSDIFLLSPQYGSCAILDFSPQERDWFSLP